MKKVCFLVSLLTVHLWLPFAAAQPAIEVVQPNSVYIWGNFNDENDNWIGAENLTGKIETYRSNTVVGIDQDGRPVVVYASSSNQFRTRFPEDMENIKDIAIGSRYSLLLTNEGEVLFFGDEDELVFPVPAELTGVKEIEGGDEFAVALTEEGRVISWGEYELDQPLEQIMSIDARADHAAAVKVDGTVIAWGDNRWGQSDVPEGLDNVVQVVCSDRATYALRSDGTVVVWGQGDLDIPSSLENAVRLVAGDFHVWAILDDGSMLGWGRSDEVTIPDAYDDLQLVAAGSGINIGITRKPVIAPQPPSNPRPYGGSELVLSSRAMGPGPVAYQWFYNGEEISGTTESELSIPRIVITHEGNYYCVVTNPFGSIRSSETVVEVRNGELVLFEDPQSQTIGLGQTFELSVEAGGIAPITYQWYQDDQLVEGAIESTYSVDEAELSDGGEYWVMIENGEGLTVDSGRVDVIVIPLPSLEPLPESLEVFAGSNVEVEISYESPVPVTFQWYKEGQPIPGETFQTLSIRNAQAASAGNYHVAISSEYGETVSNTMTLSVLPSAPMIVTDLKPKTAVLGGRFTQSVQVVGTTPLAYIWTKDEEVIEGANGELLIIPEFTEADTGTYQVEISNSEGSVLSSSALIQSFALPEGAIDFPNLDLEFISVFPQGRITAIENAGDESGRLFVASQLGTISIVKENRVLETPFLNIPLIPRFAETGLQSVAFPPDFADNGRFYVSYATLDFFDTSFRISRFSMSLDDPNVADSDSEEIILEIPKQNTIHYGGQIEFGPDGMLYVSVGDDARGDVAQDLGQFYGKILRIDPEGVESGYRVPDDNPFVGVEGALPEIWVLGLRNPWRFSFDPLTGDFFVGDVGELTWEELNFVPVSEAGGQNFGWNFFEGPDVFAASEPIDPSPFTFPIYSYQRETPANPNVNVTASIIGGYVYRGLENDRMYGMYFFGDFGNNSIYAAAKTDTEWEVNRQQFYSFYFDNSLTTFGQDESGELYVSATQGRIARVVDSERVDDVTILVDGSPSGSQFYHPITIELFTSTNGAEIFYTLDGSEPTPDSFLYDAPFMVDRSVQLSARAFRPDLEPSNIFSFPFYAIVNLEFSPGPQLIEEPIELIVSASFFDAEIRFTLDGSDPTTESPLFQSPMMIQPNSTVKLVGLLDGKIESGVLELYFPQRIGEPVVVERIAGTGHDRMLNGPVYEAEFDEPSGLLIDKDEGLLVADSRNRRIRKINVDRTVTTIAGDGISGSQDGPALEARLSLPRFLAHTVDGNLVISDAGSNLVRMTDDENYLTKFSNETIFSPGQILSRPDGSIILGSESSIVTLSPGGLPQTFFESSDPVQSGGLDRVVGITRMSDDSFLVGSQGPVILKVALDSSSEPYAGSVEGHADGAFALARFEYDRASNPDWFRVFANAPDGSVLVADGGWIRRLSPEGQVSTLVLPGSDNPPLTSIRGLAVADDGTVFASDGETHSIYRIAADSDQDGVADIDEAANGLVVGTDDATIDSDLDGFSNALEARFGTLVHDDSKFPILSLGIDFESNDLNLHVPLFRGQRSALAVSSDLIDWNEVTSLLGTEDGEMIVPIEISDGQEFFRVTFEFDFVR